MIAKPKRKIEIPEEVKVEETPETVIEEPAIPKVYEPPMLRMEEVAREYSIYKPHHLPALIAFCQSKGYPIRATEQQLIQIIEAFGWSPSLHKRKK